MLSPRTLSLRFKNRALLRALDQYPETACQYAVTEGNGVSRRQDTRNVCHRLDEYSPLNCKVTGDVCEIDTCGEMLEKTHLFGKESQVTSTDEVVQEIHSSVSSLDGMTDKIIRNMKIGAGKSMTQTNVRDRRCRSLSIEQQRSAEAQMHAPTHSHSTSKCYCTASGNVKAQPDKRYIVQLYSHRQHIPTRLKKQRYRSDSMSRHSRMVRWADYLEISSSPTKEDDIPALLPENASEVYNVKRANQESPRTSTSRHSSSGSQHESQPSLLDKVKNFRESHWYDCHAPHTEKSLSSDHECVQHYVLSKRLFFEPLHIDERGQSSCPVCLISSGPASEQFGRGRPYSHCQPNHIMITLPTAVLEPGCLHDKFVASRVEDTKTDNFKPKSCFHVSHHKHLAEKSSFTYPSDSLALRYQKKALI